MGAKEVEKRGPRAALTSQVGRSSRPKEKGGTPNGDALDSDAIQAGNGSDPEDKSALTTSPSANDKATKNPRIGNVHVPNAETAKVLREAREGKNLLHYESLEDMFKDLGI